MDGPAQAKIPEVKIMDMQSGRVTTSNASSPTCFDNELASGSYLFMHRRWQFEPDSAGDGGGASRRQQGDDYFHGKKRLWEVRFQMSFKKRVPASSMWISSSPFERMPLGASQVAAQRWLMTMLSGVVRGAYNTPGDDPRGRHPDDVETPRTCAPFWEVDQYIPPAEGGKMCLMDPAFPNLGMTKSKCSASFKKQLRGLVFEPGKIYTFAFWAPSQAFDLARWQVAPTVPLAGGLSLEVLNGPAPMFLSVYVLAPGLGKDKRHLNSRTTMVWRVAGWSSQQPPTPERMRRLEEMAISGGTAVGTSASPVEPQEPTPVPGCLSPCGAGIHRLLHRCFAWAAPAEGAHARPRASRP